MAMEFIEKIKNERARRAEGRELLAKINDIFAELEKLEKSEDK